MMKKSIFNWMVLIVILALGLSACANQPTPSTQDHASDPGSNTATPIPATGGVTASGFVVVDQQASMAFKLEGNVKLVQVKTGDQVQAGQVLVQLDDTDQQIQLAQATLALNELTSAAAIAVAQQTVAQDQQTLDNAQSSLNNQLYYTTDANAIQNALSNLVLANSTLSNVQKYYDNISGDPNTDAQKAAAYQRLYTAQQADTTAINNYNWWAGKPNQEEIDLKTAQLALAKAKLAEDQTLVGVLTGDPIPEDATGAGIVALRQADLAVQVAQANVDLLNTQIGKMTIQAPVPGVVMTRNAEPGSVVNAGAVLLTLGRLDELTITVYVPEDRIGEVLLGEKAQVSVDSFPGVIFNGAVDYISDQAEFTPRNVETVAGRETTVFAVKLSLNDTSGRLKPGMPADVTFDPK
jgi:HlyD family secretion protein